MGATQPTPRTSALSPTAGLATIVPQEVQDIAELMVREESPHQGVELHRALRQWMVGEDRGMKMPVEAARSLRADGGGRRWGPPAPGRPRRR